MASTGKTMICIGSGPGIGRSMTTLFASKGYTNVALIARRAEQLNVEGKAIERAVGSHINVKTYAVDVVDTDALVKALDDTEKEFGKPNCVFYNAARVLPSALLTHDVKEIDYDFKINVSALYVVVQKFMPHLVDLAKSTQSAQPALRVKSFHLTSVPVGIEGDA